MKRPSLKRVRLLSIDIDALHEDNGIIQSFHMGISILDTQSMQGLVHRLPTPDAHSMRHVIQSSHYVVGDMDHHRRKPNTFLFGRRHMISISDVEAVLKKKMSPSPNILVVHGGLIELSVLRRLNIQLNPLYTIDTVKAAQHPLKLFYRYSLEKLLIELKIPYAQLHHAGNDAHFTLRALLMIAVRDAEQLLKKPPDWVPIFKAVALAPRPPTYHEKCIAIGRRNREEREEAERRRHAKVLAMFDALPEDFECGVATLVTQRQSYSLLISGYIMVVLICLVIFIY